MSKHKPALPERLYYRLADAAQFLGCSADDLLHYGVCGYIELLAAIDFYWATGTDYDYRAESHFVSTSPFNNFNFFSLYAATLRLLEYKGAAYTGTAKALYKAWKGSVYRAELDSNRSVRLTEDIARHESQSDFSWQLSKTPREEIASIISGEKEWIKITHSDLWVRTAELHRFQKEGSSHVRTDPELPLNFKKPHGNAEKHALNREAVLKAAIAVKANFPDLCKTIRDWAKAIDEKARLFWPDGEPPLKLDTIERLIGESLKLPDGE